MASKWITKKARQAIYNRDDMTCCYCGKKCNHYSTEEQKNNPRDIVTLDHIVSQKELAAAAQDDAHFTQLRRDAKNLVVVCNGCNSSKQHTSLYVWCVRTGKDYTKILAEIARRVN